ncbi:hypothetical protein P9112_006835 [Eukaryota sp. TZLM1-RC]
MSSPLISPDNNVSFINPLSVLEDHCELTLSSFQEWLDHFIKHKAEHNPHFHHHITSKRLRKIHYEEIDKLEEDWRTALSHFSSCTLSSEINNLETQLTQAIVSNYHPCTINKIQLQLDLLIKVTPEYLALKQAEQNLNSFKDKIGLTKHEISLQEASFTSTENHFLDKNRILDIIGAFVADNYDTEPLLVLESVSIGKVCLNYVVIKVDEKHRKLHANVLAIVDHVEHIHNLGEVFDQWQLSLQFLTGSTETAILQRFACGVFPEGLFNREVGINVDGKSVFFDRNSFCDSFVIDQIHNCFSRNLYFICTHETLGIFDYHINNFIFNSIINSADHSNLKLTKKLFKEVKEMTNKTKYKSRNVIELKAHTNQKELIFINK